MTFTHLGEVKDGVEDVNSEKVKGWSGSMENYTLKENGDKTELTVEMPARPFRRGYHERF